MPQWWRDELNVFGSRNLTEKTWRLSQYVRGGVREEIA